MDATSRSKQAKRNRRKGGDGEREVVNLHRDHGVPAQRVPMSGASTYTHGGDVDLYPFGEDAGALVAEVKRGQKVPTWLQKTLGKNDLLFARRDRQQWVVAMPLSVYLRFCDAVKRSP